MTNNSKILSMAITHHFADILQKNYDVESNGQIRFNETLPLQSLEKFHNLSYEHFPVDPALLESFTKNQSIDEPWYHILIFMYSALIVFGALGNILVVTAVVRKPNMRTARNLFIVNLAISDLLLCLVTMPLTLMEIESKFWPFGNCAFLCKIIAMLQALSIYVSTISIIAIAFDRYQVIVYPTHDSLQFFGAVCILGCIWLLALLLASPMFIFKRLIHADIPQVLHSMGISEVSFCIEDWPVNNGRFYYSMFSLCVQYMVPILVVTIAYCGIYNKLKGRITVVTMNTSQRKVERGRRIKRTNCLLVSIAVIFGVSWLPLNFFNLYADVRRSAVTQNMLVAYAICHMIGMSSACSNPLLYGWLNDNFRKEFQELLCRCKENTNIVLNGHSIGKGQTRRRRKQSNLTKCDLKPFTSGVNSVGTALEVLADDVHGGGDDMHNQNNSGTKNACELDMKEYGRTSNLGVSTGNSNGNGNYGHTTTVTLTENPLAPKLR